jgi:hypothetical protein
MKRPRLSEELAGRLEAIVDERGDVRNAEWLDFGEQLEILLDEVEAQREDAADREEEQLRKVAEGAIQEHREERQQGQSPISKDVLEQL